MEITLPQPKVLDVTPKKIVGLRIETSLNRNETVRLWRTFMPRLNEIRHQVEGSLYSMEVFDPNMESKDFTPDTLFYKWAAVEVEKIQDIPDGMSSHLLVGGKYLHYSFKGTFEQAMKALQYVHSSWIPQSEYVVDSRAHFEVMNEKYLGPREPDSEEAFYIPVRLK